MGCRIRELGLNARVGRCDGDIIGVHEAQGLYMCVDHSQRTQCQESKFSLTEGDGEVDECTTRAANGGRPVHLIYDGRNWIYNGLF